MLASLPIREIVRKLMCNSNFECHMLKCGVQRFFGDPFLKSLELEGLLDVPCVACRYVNLQILFAWLVTLFLYELFFCYFWQDVVVIATRRIVRPPKKGSAAQRPRSRTLTAVHDAMLEDIVFPAEIAGKRVRYRIDGSKIIKVNAKLGDQQMDDNR